MKTKNLFLVYIGIAAVVIGLLIWGIFSEINVYSAVPLIIGGVALLVFVAQNATYLSAMLTKRSTMEGMNTIVGVVIFLAIVVFLQILLTKYSTIFDYTESKKFTLASQSRKVLQNLEQPVKMLYITGPRTNPRALELLDLYKRYSDKVEYEIIDAEKNPERVQALAPVTLNAVYITMDTEEQSGPSSHEKVAPVTENNLTNALLKLVGDGNRKIYFTTGHNERSIDDTGGGGISQLQGLLKDEGYQVGTVKLFETGEAPQDAAGLIVAGPKSPFLQPEIDALRNYINQGGKVMFLIDPQTDSSLEDLLKTELGVELQNNYIVEDNPLMQMFGGSPIAPTIADVGNHPIVNEMGGQIPAVMFKIAQSITLNTEGMDKVSGTEVFKTSRRSFGETNIAKLMQEGVAQQDEGEPTGPLALGVAVEKTIESATSANPTAELMEDSAEEDSSAELVEETLEARVMVFGDSDFVTNQNIRSSLNIFLNSVNWMAKQEDLISIRPKDDSGQPVFINQAQGNLVFYTSLFVIPLLMAILGTVLITIRRIARG